jgi:uncharacterized protein (DUF342 family)
MHSQLFALDTIMGGKGSALKGGHCEAGKAILADTLGADTGSATRVAIGNRVRTPLLLTFDQWVDQLVRKTGDEAERLLPMIEELSLLGSPTDPEPSVLDGRIDAQTVMPGVTIAFDTMIREIQERISRVSFALERMGDKKRIAMNRR